MKYLLITVLTFSIIFSARAQNEIYIITEKYDGFVVSPATFDSVYVTSPTGVTTKYSIPNYVTNPGEHDSQFSIILNGITSQGYKIITSVDKEGVSNPTLPEPYCIIRTLYLSRTWLTAIDDLEEKTYFVVKAYPIPTKHFLNIDINYLSDVKANYLYIINQSGIIIHSRELQDESNLTLDTSKLSTGIYYIGLLNSVYYSIPTKIIIQ